MNETILAPSTEAIRRAAELLRAGELVGMPTETVYGLAAAADNAEAVRRIFALKGRPADHPVIVHLADAAQLSQWATDIPREAAALARAFWPGPLTMILKRAPGVLDEVTGGQNTVGLRVPDHPVALALLKIFGSGIAAPSANRFGALSPTKAIHVFESFGKQLTLILDGDQSAIGIESTIVDLSGETPRILRPGFISVADIAQVIGLHPDARDDGRNAPRAPGALPAHYAPKARLNILPFTRLAQEAAQLAAQGKRVGVLARRVLDPGNSALLWHAMPVDVDSYAHGLYAALHDLDAAGVEWILVEALPDDADWYAVQNRLDRAAAGSGAAES